MGLLFTNEPYDVVVQYFQSYTQPDYARSGSIATQTITLPEGPVQRGVDPMPHNMEPLLRQLGMPTTLKNGIVTLPVPYTICREGETLSTNQAHLLVSYSSSLFFFYYIEP